MSKLLFPSIKRVSARQQIDLDAEKNVLLYDVAQAAQFEQSANCKRPQSCNAIFQSLQKPHEYDPQFVLNLPWSTASTPCMNTPRNLRYRQAVRLATQLAQPYRTVSHFGFNSPTQLPQPEHKHIPLNQPRSLLLQAACSYEDVLGSPRYVDLCNNCFEQLVRLKPELVPIRTRLRNLAETQATQTAEFVAQADMEECVPQPGLETVIEVDENRTSELNEEQAHNSQSSFERRISNMNFSKESTNTNYQPPLIADSVLSMEIQTLNDENDDDTQFYLAEVQEATSVSQSACKIEILEVIEFGNWMKTDGVLDCQYRSSSDTQVVHIKESSIFAEHSSTESDSDSKTSRDERKEEFQDVWEDHMNFFTGKEKAQSEEVATLAKSADTQTETESAANADANNKVEEIYRSPPEVEFFKNIIDQEVFMGCSLIVHNLKTDNKQPEVAAENMFVLPTSEFLETNEIKHQSTPFFRESDIQKAVSYYILHGNDNTLDMDVNVNTNTSTFEAADREEEYKSLAESELSWRRMQTQASQASEQDTAADASDENSYNSVEYEILEKIGVNDLKRKSLIFEKIDNSVRNKLTPKRMHEILQNSQDNATDNANVYVHLDDEKPTTSARAMENFKKFMCEENIEETQEDVPIKENNVETDNLCVISTCSTFSIDSNKNTDEDAQVPPRKYSNASICKHEKRGKRTIRNFVRENIKNASKPRASASREEKFMHKQNLSAIFSTCPFGEAYNKKRKRAQSVSTSSSASCQSQDKHTSPIYTFKQQEKEAGVQSLWMSMSPRATCSSKNKSDTSLKSSKSIKRKLFENKKLKKMHAEKTQTCSSSLLKLTPLRGIGLKPLSDFQLSPEFHKKKQASNNLNETKVCKQLHKNNIQAEELSEQNSDKENKTIADENADSTGNQENVYHTAESNDIQQNILENVSDNGNASTVDELLALETQHAVNKEEVLSNYLLELLSELEEDESLV